MGDIRSITNGAVEIYGITRILDYFESQSYVSKFGMVGLSLDGIHEFYKDGGPIESIVKDIL